MLRRVCPESDSAIDVGPLRVGSTVANGLNHVPKRLMGDCRTI